MVIQPKILSQPRPPFSYTGIFLEAASGFEPLHRGFADPRLNHLATPPRNKNGAEDGARTRDILLGKEAFYH